MTDDRPLVVGVDASDGGRRALRWALGEAHLWRRPLHVLAAWSYLDQTALTKQGFLPEFDQAAADAALHDIVQDERPGTAEVDLVERAVLDLPARALVEVSEQAELLVVGARGLGSVKSLLLGSVSDQVVRHSSCPVAVIRDEPPSEARNEIVVGVDGSARALAALRWAIAEAARRGARVRAIHAWQYPPVSGMGWDASAVDFDSFEAAAKEGLAEVLDAVDDVSGGVELDGETKEGHAGTTLLEAAQGAEMLVVGDRGAGGFAGLLLGSTTTHCLHHAHGPVIVVR